MKRRFVLVLVLACLAPSCRVARFSEQERLDSWAMRFDPDPLYAELLGHVLTPREASVGGFGPVGAGGCGCH